MLHLINRKYENISCSDFLLQIIPCRFQRKQQMHPNQVFCFFVGLYKENANLCWFWEFFWWCASFRQTFLLREFPVLCGRIAIITSDWKIGTWVKKQGQLQVVLRLPSESPYYATLLSLPHSRAPASTLTWAEPSVLWVGSCSVGGEGGSLVRDVNAFNREILDSAGKFSNWYMYCQCGFCRCRIFTILAL